VAGKYNEKYRKIREKDRVRKVFKLKKYRKINQAMIVRFKYENEERANKYWKNFYRLCGKREETMEHITRECKGMIRMKDITKHETTSVQERWRGKEKEKESQSS
jgi:hypothetical protein